jgi:prevent-host-death family protein
LRTIDIREAKTHLSRLIEQAANGEPFIIAKAGKPLVKVMPLEAPTGAQIRRLGFMAMRRAATLTPEGRKPFTDART